MKTLKLILVLSFAVITFTSAESFAWVHAWRGGPVGGWRFAPNWNHGYWHHGWYAGHFGWWWVVGPSWYFYAAAPVYPYPVAQPVYIYPAP